MNPEPPPIADPHSTAPLPESEAVTLSTQNLARSGWRLAGAGLFLFLCFSVFLPTDTPFAVLPIEYIAVFCVAVSCFFFGCFRLVQAFFLFMRSHR